MTNNHNRKFETPYCRFEIFGSKMEVFTFYDANDELWYMHYVIDEHWGPQASCTARTKREIKSRYVAKLQIAFLWHRHLKTRDG
jgi:hypothetical protein